MKVQLKNVRLAFCNIFVPTTVNGEGEPAYNVACLFDRKSPNAALMEEAILATAKAKWPTDYKELLPQLKKKDKVCLKDGDDKEYDGYAGNFYVPTRSDTRPTVLDRDKTPLTKDDGKPYSGCYANVVIEVWAQDNKYGKRINAQLKGVQFVKDGDAFGGSAPASADDFEEVEGGDDDGDLV